MPPASPDQESPQQTDADQQLQSSAIFPKSDHSMAAYGKLLLRWANTDAVRDFYFKLKSENIWRVVEADKPLPILSLIYTPTKRALTRTNATFMLSRLVLLGITLQSSTAVDSRGSISLPEQVPHTYASTPSLALYPTNNTSNEVPDIEMEAEPTVDELRVQQLTDMLDLGPLAANFGPRTLRDYLRVFNKSVQCLVLQNLVGFASTYLIILMFTFGNGWCSADDIKGQHFTLAAFHASYTIHHARMVGKGFTAWHQLNGFAETCEHFRVVDILFPTNWLLGAFRGFAYLHFITESSMVSLRAAAQVTVRTHFELLVLAKWHVFDVDDVCITAGQVVAGAEELIEEMLAFLKNPSSALVCPYCLVLTSTPLIISQVEVEGKAPQPGQLHTVLTSLYTDFFLRGPASLKKKANALAAYWEPIWPHYKALNPGVFQVDGVDKPINSYININLIPFKHQAPIGGFTMLFTAVCSCLYCPLCTPLTPISFLLLRMRCAPRPKRARLQLLSPNFSSPTLFRRLI